MKNKLFLLLKTNLLNSFKIRSTTTRKKILMGVAILYIIGALLFSLGMYEKQIFTSFEKQNLVTYFLIIIFAIASIFSFLFTIYSAKAGLFENKDNNLLCSLPIKKSTILFSRLLYLVLYNLVIGLIFIVPGLVIYIKSVDVNIMFYVSVLVLLLLFSIIPTVLACIFGYLVAILTSKTKRKNIFEMIFYLIFIGAYLGLYLNANKLLSLFVNNVALINNILKYGFLPIFLMGKTINTGNILYLLYFILLNVGVLYLFIMLLNKSYYKIISKLNSHASNSKFIMKNIDNKSIKKTLREKELKRYFSSPIYVFNTGCGIIILIVVAFASIFTDLNAFLQKSAPSFSVPFPLLVFSLLLFIIFMTDTTCSSISIERNNFWILKVLPVKVKEVLSAKKFVNLIILIPACIFAIIMFYITGYVSLKDTALLLLFAVLFSYFIANFGLIINLLFPNFNAVNDAVIVKQSTSTFVSIGVPALLSIVFIGFITSLNININLLLIISILVSLVLAVISYIILNTWGIKKFNKLR